MNGLNTMESRGLLLRLLKEEEITETAERTRGVYMIQIVWHMFSFLIWWSVFMKLKLWELEERRNKETLNQKADNLNTAREKQESF